jgi:hypothetical protein
MTTMRRRGRRHLAAPQAAMSHGGFARQAARVAAVGSAASPATILADASRRVRVASRWQYLPLAIAVCYLVVLATQLATIVHGDGTNADVVAPYVLAKLISTHRGTVWLGASAWYSALLFDIVTRWLPFYRLVWEAAPFFATAAAIAATVWSVGRVAGRWAAVVAFSLLTCSLLVNLRTLNDHVLTWCSASLLIAGLVLVTDPRRPIRRSRWLPCALALGLLVAVNLASDPLLYAAGVLPVLIGALVANRRMRSERSREGVVYALITVAIALVGSVVVLHLMHSARIVPAVGPPLRAAQPSHVLGNVALWWRSITWLGGGWGAGGSALAAIVGPAAGVLTAAMVVLIPLVAFRETRAPAAPAATTGGGAQDVSAAAARIGFVVAWATAAVLISLAFVLSNAPSGLGTARYLVGVWFAAGALAPFVARGGRRTAVIAVAATVYCASGLVVLAGGAALGGSTPTQAQANAFLALARKEHASHGYSGYWDAGPITWETDFKLPVYPVIRCGYGLCQMKNAEESAWYRRRHDGRTFLIIDTAKPWLHQAPLSLGAPVASFHVGRSYVFEVFDYEIANRMATN